MTRGYLSLRHDESNPSHHLYLNTGGRGGGIYWVAFTIHFGGKKRRLKRSLGTKCLAEAIRRRDTLFADIARDGLEVPERGTKRRRNEESEDEMLVTRSTRIRLVTHFRSLA